MSHAAPPDKGVRPMIDAITDLAHRCQSFGYRRGTAAANRNAARLLRDLGEQVRTMPSRQLIELLYKEADVLDAQAEATMKLADDDWNAGAQVREMLRRP